MGGGGHSSSACVLKPRPLLFSYRGGCEEGAIDRESGGSWRAEGASVVGERERERIGGDRGREREEAAGQR